MCALWAHQGKFATERITFYFTVVAQPSSVKGAFKHLQSPHTYTPHAPHQPVYSLGVFTDHQQSSQWSHGILQYTFKSWITHWLKNIYDIFYEEDEKSLILELKLSSQPSLVNQALTCVTPAYNGVMFKTSQRISALWFLAITEFSLMHKAWHRRAW